MICVKENIKMTNSSSLYKTNEHDQELPANNPPEESRCSVLKTFKYKVPEDSYLVVPNMILEGYIIA